MVSDAQKYIYLHNHHKQNLSNSKEKNKHGLPTFLLLDFISMRFPYLPREQWESLIKAKRVLVNDAATFCAYKLCNKDEITYLRKQEEEPRVEKKYQILYQDEEIVVLEKGGNLPVSRSGRYWHNTLISFLEEEQGLTSFYPVHRLDKETSGVLVIAKTKLAAQSLGQSFANQEQTKIYHAILVGDQTADSFVVEEKMGKNFGQSSVHIRQICKADGKPAKSLFRVLARACGLSFVEVRTFTGRTHQIRLHAEFMEHPLLGDKLYGWSDENFLMRLRTKTNPQYPQWGEVTRHMLHASFFAFEHPKSKKKLAYFSSPLAFFEPWFSRFFADQHTQIQAQMQACVDKKTSCSV